MSPEQASGTANIDGRSDQYSLGCVAYELLSGEPPFTGPTPMAITARKLTESLPPLRTRRTAVTPQVEAALSRALERAPSDRFRTMHEFISALNLPTTGETPLRAAAPRRGWLAPVAAVVIVAVAAIAWALGANGSSGAVADESAIAVLPFENLTADSSQAFFAQGLADELVTSLSMVEGMRVASRTSTSALLRRGLELDEIARQLNVGAVLEGSVRLAGDRVRVSTRLVSIDQNRPIWSETYERPSADVLRIQEEIATAIVGALRGRMLRENLAVVSSGTDDPVAYGLYLRAQNLRVRQTERTLNEAVEAFQAVIDRAPTFARAHAGLANTHAVMGWYDYEAPSVAFPKALASAEAALRLEPRNAMALNTIAYATLYYKWDFPAAEKAFLASLEADPNLPLAHQWYANYLAVTQRWEEAEREFEMALRLDPAAPVRHAVMSWVKAHRGDIPGAIERFDIAARFDSTYAPTFQWGAISLELAGRLADAKAALERAVALSERNPAMVANLARLNAVNGDRAEAQRLLREVLAARVVPAYEVAKVHLALGDRAEAMRWLQRAFENRSHSMVFLRIDPQLKPLRGDPAFEALAKNVGI
jgi:TolB-like protein/tetratricopeptide (TPR) repeat protein